LLLTAACPKKPEPPAPVTPWAPGTAYPSEREPTARGFLDRRGVIHAHTPYSHDACDGKPRTDAGTIDMDCYDDFRRGLCQSRNDFVFLSDHNGSFGSTEFPDAILYRADRGDALIEHGAGPTANWAACPDAAPALVMAGCESGSMPVGLEAHVAATEPERGAIYGSATPESIAKFKALHAVSLAQHTETWTPEQLVSLPLDGFEMYNVHANLFLSLGLAADLMFAVERGDQGLPHPDLLLLTLVSEDPVYLETWGTVLSRGAKRVTTMATDCHRNSLPQVTADGERIDGYRRMMSAFSNHLLVQPKQDGTWDDRDLKDALRAGRLYGVFDFLGHPQGFDFYALEAGEVREMGAQVSLAKGVELRVTRPAVQNLATDVEAPVVKVRLLKAKEGGWDEVAAGESDLAFTVTTPGAYRAEVRMVPKHLRAFVGKRMDLLKKDTVWVYSNAVYVEP
jgi:hypothetical protein